MKDDDLSFPERIARVRVRIGAARISPGYADSPLKAALERCWVDLNNLDLCREGRAGDDLLRRAEMAVAAFEIVA